MNRSNITDVRCRFHFTGQRTGDIGSINNLRWAEMRIGTRANHSAWRVGPAGSERYAFFACQSESSEGANRPLSRQLT
jgi:hypothetical protein